MAIPTVYELKPHFQALLRPLVSGLAARGVTPNQITLATFVACAAVGGVLAWAPDQRTLWLAVPLVLLVRMGLNAVDGMLAREHGMVTRLGTYLNEVGDVLADACLYLPLGLVPGVEPALVWSVVLAGTVVELTGIVGVQVGASRRYDGPMGKSDRALVMGALALALGVGAPTGPWFDAVLTAVVALAAWTVWRRARRALAEGEPAP